MATARCWKRMLNHSASSEVLQIHAWTNQIGDILYPMIGGAEVGIGAECNVIKRIGTSVCTDVPIFHKAADELAVDAVPWVVHNLFDF